MPLPGGLGTAASRLRGAASPATDLLQPNAKRQRNRPTTENSPFPSGAASSGADAAGQTTTADGSAIAASSQATEDPVQIQLNDEVLNRADSGQAMACTDALAERLVSVLSQSGSFPAPSGQPPAATDMTVGMLQAIDVAVEQVWQTRKADLPKESALKPKAYAWLAADLMGDPFLPPEPAVKLGKVIQTRAAALHREQKAERDKSSGERRLAERMHAEHGYCLQGSLEEAQLDIAADLRKRLDALHATPYPAYAKAYRPPLAKDAATEDATTGDDTTGDAATEDAATAAAPAVAAAVTTTDDGDAADVCEIPVVERSRLLRSRVQSLLDHETGFEEGLEQGTEALAAAHALRTATVDRYEQERAAMMEQHKTEVKFAERQSKIDGAQEMLWEFQSQIQDVAGRMGRQVEGAFRPLSAWVEEQIATLQEQDGQTFSAAHAARWESAEQIHAIWSLQGMPGLS